MDNLKAILDFVTEAHENWWLYYLLGGVLLLFCVGMLSKIN